MPGFQDTVEGFVNSAAGYLNDGASDDRDATEIFKDFYAPLVGNWYKAAPYGFQFTPRAGKKIVMFLPISPSNLSIVTHYATNVVTTLYGVVEEHSEVRYYDITIQGTTGYGPTYVDPGSSIALTSSFGTSGRSTFTDDSISLGGFFQQTVGVINQVRDQFQDLVGEGDRNETGIAPLDSGYMAFHNLYRFFLTYKKDTAGLDKNHISGRRVPPLTFFNFKDGNKYDVVPGNFTLTRSKESPMLYNYSLKLRAYNLRAVEAAEATAAGTTDFLASLGLGTDEEPIGSQSVFGEMADIASNTMGVVSGIASGASILGG